MLRTLFLLIVGLAIGYFIGFSDARKHDQDIIQRLVNKAGGAARGNVSGDIDARIEKSGR